MFYNLIWFQFIFQLNKYKIKKDLLVRTTVTFCSGWWDNLCFDRAEIENQEQKLCWDDEEGCRGGRGGSTWYPARSHQACAAFVLVMLSSHFALQLPLFAETAWKYGTSHTRNRRLTLFTDGSVKDADRLKYVLKMKELMQETKREGKRKTLVI